MTRKRTQKEILSDAEIGPLDLDGYAERIGVAKKTAKNYRLAGRLADEDFTRSGIPLWWASTIDKHQATRPGRGRWGPRSRVAVDEKAAG